MGVMRKFLNRSDYPIFECAEITLDCNIVIRAASFAHTLANMFFLAGLDESKGSKLRALIVVIRNPGNRSNTLVTDRVLFASRRKASMN
jgi:hypothetical protein